MDSWSARPPEESFCRTGRYKNTANCGLTALVASAEGSKSGPKRDLPQIEQLFRRERNRFDPKFGDGVVADNVVELEQVEKRGRHGRLRKQRLRNSHHRTKRANRYGDENASRIHRNENSLGHLSQSQLSAAAERIGTARGRGIVERQPQCARDVVHRDWLKSRRAAARKREYNGRQTHQPTENVHELVFRSEDHRWPEYRPP